MPVNSVILVLMRRDRMSLTDATDFYNDCLEELQENLDDMDYEEMVDWIAQNFGLEPDYMDEILQDLRLI